MRLIAPAHMSDEESMKFQSSLREVMLFIKYSKDRENLGRILEFNEKRFREVERRAADVIEVITNSGMKYDKGEVNDGVRNDVPLLRSGDVFEYYQKPYATIV